MPSKASPLHGVVDARRWDAERILGRLVIVVHAAFLDAGFIVPRRHRRDRDLSSTCRLPAEVGATASTLSLEYTAPQLLPRHDMDAAALRLCTDGRHVVFYLQVCSARISTYWVCLDALSVAPLLSGDLNGTARRLMRKRNDGSPSSPTATLWRTVSDGFSRRIFSDLCREHGVVPGRAPTFMSLPSDAKAAILERLVDGKDLLMVESTCTELRQFVADRDSQLWMARYEALGGGWQWWYWSSLLGNIDSRDEKSTSWKEKFVRATRQWEDRFLVRPTPAIIIIRRFSILDEWKWFLRPGRYSVGLPVDDAACFGETMTETEGDGGKSTTGRRHGHGKAPATGGREKQQSRRTRNGTGAIHSPSARYRWKHR